MTKLPALRKRLLVWAVLSAIPIASVLAAEPYERSGRIDEVNLGSGYVIIDDRQYAMIKDVPIHAGNQLVKPSSLQKGQVIEFNFSTSPNAQRVVTEIRLNPSR